MSYLFLDVYLAMRSNLIPSDGKIHDLYALIWEELKPFFLQ